MQIRFSGEYKSLTNFEWFDIPKFVVITGPNGSGKTHLLELINESLSSNKPFSWKFEVDGIKVNFDEIVYLKDDWGIKNIQPVDISKIQASHKHRFTNAFANFDKPNVNIVSSYRENEILKKEYDTFTTQLGKTKRHQVTYDEFCLKYPRNLLKLDVPIHEQINNVFYHYYIQTVETRPNGISDADLTALIGPPPWEVVRDIIRVANLPFTINDPIGLSLWDSFELKLKHLITKKEIRFVDLSSGEKILISIIFYLYQSQERQIFPKLLIMDEPDAHLHPSMSQQFMNVVKNVLVDKFGIQVFMTTHSPSTVMFTHPESLFEMSISEPRIRLSASKNHSVSLLTSGLVFVGDGTRYFLVEDKPDVDFYSFITGQLVEQNLIKPEIPFVFIPASTNTATGGKTVVKSWVGKLLASGLTGIIYGLIDRDNNNLGGEGIFVIKRYSIENYLIDPLVQYAALIELESDFQIEGLSLTMGEEYKIKSLSHLQLQLIADTICNIMEKDLSNFFQKYPTDKVNVSFSNSIVLQYPRWLLDLPGKTILNNICNKVFESKINHGSLFRAFKRLNLLPMDLAEMFKEIQNQ